MLSPLLGALELKCNNTSYRPVMDAIDLLRRCLDQPLEEGAFFDPAESVPLAGVGPEHWRAAAVDDSGRAERIPYELCVLVALRDAVRRRHVVRMVPSRRDLEWVIVSFRCRVGCARCRCPGRWSGPGLRRKRLPVPGR